MIQPDRKIVSAITNDLAKAYGDSVFRHYGASGSPRWVDDMAIYAEFVKKMVQFYEQQGLVPNIRQLTVDVIIDTLGLNNVYSKRQDP